jgi:hypothetical protein
MMKLSMRPAQRWTFVALTTLWLSAAACYDTTSLRVTAQSPQRTQDCVQLADRAFREADFERVPTMRGPDMFYTPRMTSYVALRWGIGVWLNGRGDREDSQRCTFELEAMGADAGCAGLTCPYSSQRGAEYDARVKDMARRLSKDTRPAGTRE